MEEPKFKGYSEEHGEWFEGFGWCITDYTEEYMQKQGIEQEAMLYTHRNGVIQCTLNSMEQIH